MSTHALYRFFDAAGDLLYIGITNDPSKRFGRHASDKPWWEEVDRIDLERHPSREAVLAAEAAAIKTERPRYNVRHGGPTSIPDATLPVPPRCACGAPGVVLYVLYRDLVEKAGRWRASCEVHRSGKDGAYAMGVPRTWREWVDRTACLMQDTAWLADTDWSGVLYEVMGEKG